MEVDMEEHVVRSTVPGKCRERSMLWSYSKMVSEAQELGGALVLVSTRGKMGQWTGLRTWVEWLMRVVRSGPDHPHSAVFSALSWGTVAPRLEGRRFPELMRPLWVMADPAMPLLLTLVGFLPEAAVLLGVVSGARFPGAHL